MERPSRVHTAFELCLLLLLVSGVAFLLAGADVYGAPVQTAPTPAQAEPPVVVTSAVAASAPLAFPIDNALARVTKKPFGLLIEKGTSPVPNDRFTGYHVGVDFETTEAEKDMDVPIVAACDGPLLLKEFAKGYGGVAVQSCMLDGEPVTVLYGHLNLASIAAEPGDTLATGDRIGVLGQGYSEETDGVRKHLHFSVHKGTEIDIRGYVHDPAEIDAWLDPMDYLSE